VLIDSSEIDRDDTIDCDVCIVGAGAAGITVARRFLPHRARVVLLESGGADFEPHIQALAQGSNEGLPYYDLADSRLRFFGGTTAIWGGRSTPMDDIDFRARPWVPHSGWPLSPGDLAPWYAQARQTLELPDLGPAEAVCAKLGIAAPPFDRDRLRIGFWQFDQQPGRFALERCDDLRRSANVAIITHATVTHIQAARGSGAVLHVEVADPGGQRARVRARYFVLAAGGLENARLMLHAADVQPHGLGNDRDLVGRFFMEHPHARGGRVVTSEPWKLLRWFAVAHWLDGRRVSLCLRPGEAIQEHRQGLNTSFALACRQHPDDALPLAARLYRYARHRLPPSRSNRRLWIALKRNMRRLQTRADPLRPWLQTVLGRRGLYAVLRAEQAPDPASRVRLGEDRDSLGMRRLCLDWRLSELDRHGARVAMEALDAELRRLRLGRLEFAPWLREPGGGWEFDPLISSHPIAGFHHMGTTRMAHHCASGVIDPDCRVFGFDNLYVAGSSVFPTGGWANPTLTLLALSLRLAEHLAGRCERAATAVLDDPGAARGRTRGAAPDL
jgi:choline dehydrogenase-like flavoprotein